jgi:hypothetical protein
MMLRSTTLGGAVSSDAVIPPPPASPGTPTLDDLERAKGLKDPATLETLPDAEVFDDGEVEEFLGFVAEQRRATLA